MISISLARLQDLFRTDIDGPLTLRAIAPAALKLAVQNRNFLPCDYPTLESRWLAFADSATELNGAGYNIYTCLNPIRPEHSRLAVKDDAIASRRLLLIDLDRSGKTDCPATEGELDEARRVADDIEDWMLGRKCDRAARVMSGNGIHLFYRLADLPNDKSSHETCRTFLRVLSMKFDTSSVKVDTTVHNASRIVKVPGTIARKGLATVDRPYRMADFV